MENGCYDEVFVVLHAHWNSIILCMHIAHNANALAITICICPMPIVTHVLQRTLRLSYPFLQSLKIIRFAEKCSFYCAIRACTRSLATKSAHRTYWIVLHYICAYWCFYFCRTETKCWAMKKRQNDILMILNFGHGRLIIHSIWTLSLAISCTSNPILNDFNFCKKKKNTIFLNHLRDHQMYQDKTTCK